MKIVVLDGFLLNPGDLSWDELKKLGDCSIYDRSIEKEIIERAKDAEVLIVNKIVLKKEQIDQLPKLKYIGETATGYDNIDVTYAKEKGILVTNVPSYGTSFVAQHTIALLLEVTNQVGLHYDAVKAGEWVKAPDFSFSKKALIELEGLNLGIIGYGAIGQAVAKLARAFGMNILTTSRKVEDSVDQETLFRKSDIITLHCKLTEETKHLINEQTLSLMKPSAILLNASRGSLIDERALRKALQEKKIYAAAIDVLENEPPREDCPLLGLENCIITPHIAWASQKARGRLLHTVEENLKAYQKGSPINVI